jgi:threonine/homoserine/homoserine lactone efflux protein
MLGTTDFALFVVSALLLNMTPGPDTLYILGRSATQGLRGGVIASLGIGAGCLVHICAATFGLSALLMASAGAFTIVKWMGAVYLVWMGIDLIRNAHAPAAGAPALPSVSFGRIFAQGFLTNALNPKVALFFLAFLPQFVAADAANKTLAFLFLGVVFNVNGTLWNLLVATVASRASGRMAPAVRTWLNRTLGGALVVIGARLATARL